MLEQEETQNLIAAAKNGDTSSSEKLIVENMPLIKSVVRRYAGKNVEYEDLLQLGSMGLLKAILNFDTSFGVRFSTYAVPMIAGEIKRFLRDDGVVKVSRAMKVLSYNMSKFVETYNQENNREPTVEEIAAKFEIDKEEVVFALESTHYPLSLYDKNDEDNLSLIEKISVSSDDDDSIDKMILAEVLKELPPRDKKIIALRYFRDKTQSEVAEVLGVSQVQVSRLENKIIAKLKEKFEI